MQKGSCNPSPIKQKRVTDMNQSLSTCHKLDVTTIRHHSQLQTRPPKKKKGKKESKRKYRKKVIIKSSCVECKVEYHFPFMHKE